ncbi:transport protein SEC23-like [Pyrus ussuriensis x Pyrus communis]|uniref:Transport protein SEC23-like n=1 Tax=Pyrus ussuriensis x Pyrus communis TaxID=2448454 RepID=A0A5N5FV14_9ROSA|nr:transport protein SEC23-like [Pyrus ussuriensis x Pyrus communis]
MEAESLRQSRLEKRELLDHADVDDENKDRMRGGFFNGRVILNGGVLGEKLNGEVLVGDGGVVGRKVVTGEAERADPDLGGVIDGGEGVENEAAMEGPGMEGNGLIEV